MERRVELGVVSKHKIWHTDYYLNDRLVAQLFNMGAYMRKYSPALKYYCAEFTTLRYGALYFSLEELRLTRRW